LTGGGSLGPGFHEDKKKALQEERLKRNAVTTGLERNGLSGGRRAWAFPQVEVNYRDQPLTRTYPVEEKFTELYHL